MPMMNLPVHDELLYAEFILVNSSVYCNEASGLWLS